MSRRNPRGSSAAKRRKRIRDWRPPSPPAIGETFWPELMRLGDRIVERLNASVGTGLGYAGLVRTDKADVAIMTDRMAIPMEYGLATRTFQYFKDKVIITEESPTAPMELTFQMFEINKKDT